MEGAMEIGVDPESVQLQFVSSRGLAPRRVWAGFLAQQQGRLQLLCLLGGTLRLVLRQVCSVCLLPARHLLLY